MRDMRSFRLLAAAVALSAATASRAAPAVGVETHVQLAVAALVVEEGKSKPAGGKQQTEIGPNFPGSVDLVVPWHPKGASVTVHLDVRLTSLAPGGEAVLICE